MKKVVISIAVLAVAAFVFFLNGINRNDEIGDVTIIIVNELGETLSNKEYGFTEEDSLFELLNDEFELGCADNSYKLSDDCTEKLGGRVLMKIDSVQTDWMNTYLAIYINEEYSTLGIDNIPLVDGNTYKFEHTEVGEEYAD
jgi:hypothetical protein